MDIRRVLLLSKPQKNGPSVNVRILLHFLRRLLMAHAAILELEEGVLANERTFLLLPGVVLHVLLRIGRFDESLQLPIDFHLEGPRHDALGDGADQLDLRIGLSLLLEGGLEAGGADDVAGRDVARLHHYGLAEGTLVHSFWRGLETILHVHVVVVAAFDGLTVV